MSISEIVAPDLHGLRNGALPIRIEKRRVSLREEILESLSSHLNVSRRDIFSQDNSEKYYNAEDPHAISRPLEEVFGLMRDLNAMALSDPTIGCASGNGACFRSALEKVTDDIRDKFGRRAFDYIEFGPEPSKTAAVLRRLMARGAVIRRYVSVDINPASAAHMRRALADVLGDTQIAHVTKSFDELDDDDLKRDDTPALITTLGFQECNEAPEISVSRYTALLRPGDHLLSEVQLRTERSWEPIRQFYCHPFMQRFSRVAFERAFGDRPSETRVEILPVRDFAGEPVHAAILLEQPTELRHDLPRLFVSNYCLKYSERQFRALRETAGSFRVVTQRLTGDRSVAFQLSRRN